MKSNTKLSGSILSAKRLDLVMCTQQLNAALGHGAHLDMDGFVLAANTVGIVIDTVLFLGNVETGWQPDPAYAIQVRMPNGQYAVWWFNDPDVIVIL